MPKKKKKTVKFTTLVMESFVLGEGQIKQIKQIYLPLKNSIPLDDTSYSGVVYALEQVCSLGYSICFT